MTNIDERDGPPQSSRGMIPIDEVSANSADGQSHILGTTRNRFLAFVRALDEFRSGFDPSEHQVVSIPLHPLVLHLPVPAVLGEYSVRVFDSGLTALTWESGTTMQCMSGDPPQHMGSITMPRESVFHLPAHDTSLLCTLGQSRAGDRWVARVDGFLSEEQAFIVHVASPRIESRAFVLDCLRSVRTASE